MKKPCKIPCVECPFTKDSAPGWLGPWESPLELHQFVMGEQPFPCHMSMETDNEKYCKGALLYMSKNAKSPRDPKLSRLVKEGSKDSKENIFYSTEFLKHHS